MDYADGMRKSKRPWLDWRRSVQPGPDWTDASAKPVERDRPRRSKAGWLASAWIIPSSPLQFRCHRRTNVCGQKSAIKRRDATRDPVWTIIPWAKATWLPSHLLGEHSSEVNLAELLDIDRREFRNTGGTAIQTVDESALEAEWPALRNELSTLASQWARLPAAALISHPQHQTEILPLMRNMPPAIGTAASAASRISAPLTSPRTRR